MFGKFQKRGYLVDKLIMLIPSRMSRNILQTDAKRKCECRPRIIHLVTRYPLSATSAWPFGRNKCSRLHDTQDDWAKYALDPEILAKKYKIFDVLLEMLNLDIFLPIS